MYTKVNEDGDFLILYLHAEDLAFIRNKLCIFEKFKNSMFQGFKMTDVMLMFYYLGNEVKQDKDVIFSLRKVMQILLLRSSIRRIVILYILVGCRVKLSKYDFGRKVDATYFKSLVGSYHT